MRDGLIVLYNTDSLDNWLTKDFSESIEVMKRLKNNAMEIKNLTGTEQIKINVPEGYEIDYAITNLSKGEIFFKKIEEPTITYKGLIKRSKFFEGYYVNDQSVIISIHSSKPSDENKNVCLKKKQAKFQLAISQISQLMPDYGGKITDDEWLKGDVKHIIIRMFDEVSFDTTPFKYSYLAFHTTEQCVAFYKNNERLVKDYLMID